MSVSPSVDMLPFGVTISDTVPQSSEIPEGLMNYPVYDYFIKTPICCDLPSRKLAADAKERCTILLIYCIYLYATKRSYHNDLFNFVLIWDFVFCFVGLFATDCIQSVILNFFQT
jgi:hypothetical protein